MIMKIVKEWWGAGIGVLIVAGYFIEISKIKINPISFVLTRLGTAFNKPTLDQLAIQKKEMEDFGSKLELMSKKLDETDKKIDVNEVKRIRAEIMSFATSCKKREEHNEQQFQTIIKLHEEYEKLIESVELTNGVLDEDYEFIMMVYRHCRDSGKFYPGHCYIEKP